CVSGKPRSGTWPMTYHCLLHGSANGTELEAMDDFRQADDNVLAQVDAVFTDVDDTLTRDGKLAPSALTAMARLLDAGVRVIPVTGGCAGWCDHMVRAWPVTAVIGESGAFRFTHSRHGGLRQQFVRDRATMRAEQR